MQDANALFFLLSLQICTPDPSTWHYGSGGVIRGALDSSQPARGSKLSQLAAIWELDVLDYSYEGRAVGLTCAHVYYILMHVLCCC
jgi:hypothetical protein